MRMPANENSFHKLSFEDEKLFTGGLKSRQPEELVTKLAAPDHADKDREAGQIEEPELAGQDRPEQEAV